MREFSLIFPEHFDEDASLIESKGWLAGVTVVVGIQQCSPEFYDTTRFAQTVADDVRLDGMAVPENIVVLPEVTRGSVENAVQQLAESDFAGLRPLPR
jgi:hypothetical protein